MSEKLPVFIVTAPNLEHRDFLGPLHKLNKKKNIKTMVTSICLIVSPFIYFIVKIIMQPKMTECCKLSKANNPGLWVRW